MNDLSPSRIEGELVARGIGLGRPLTIVAETESTNDDAKRAARLGIATGAAFIADSQSRGRGRRGHVWHSPKGDNVYVSFVLRPDLLARDTPPLALAAGLAVVDSIAHLVPGDRLRIKWPNDVLLDGKKLAGVLVEAQIRGDRADAVIVGIGLNVHGRGFPPELSSVATSLAMAGAHDLDRGAIFVALCQALERRVNEQVTRGVSHTVEALASLDYLAGKTISLEGERCVALGIDAEGRLRARGEDGLERAVSAGQVTIGTR